MRQELCQPTLTFDEEEGSDDELVVEGDMNKSLSNLIPTTSHQSSSSRPVPTINEGGRRIGNLNINSSHSMVIYRGIEYCNICYFKVTITKIGKQIRNLSRPCVGRPTDSNSTSARFKQRIENKKLPVGFTKWPDEV